jgi:hypothetical protein
MGENASRFANKYLLSIGPCDSTAYHSGSPETSAKAKQTPSALTSYSLQISQFYTFGCTFAALPDIHSIELPEPQFPARDSLDRKACSQAMKTLRSFDITVLALEPSMGKR